MRRSISAQSWLSVPPAPACTPTTAGPVSYSPVKRAAARRPSSERGSAVASGLCAMAPLELLARSAPAGIVAADVALRVDGALLDDRHRLHLLDLAVRHPGGGQRLERGRLVVLVQELVVALGGVTILALLLHLHLDVHQRTHRLLLHEEVHLVEHRRTR